MNSYQDAPSTITKPTFEECDYVMYNDDGEILIDDTIRVEVEPHTIDLNKDILNQGLDSKFEHHSFIYQFIKDQAHAHKEDTYFVQDLSNYMLFLPPKTKKERRHL